MLLFIDDDFYAFLLISTRSLSKAKDGKMTESLMGGYCLFAIFNTTDKTFISDDIDILHTTTCDNKEHTNNIDDESQNHVPRGSKEMVKGLASCLPANAT